MGSGSYANGRFDLKVSLRHDADEGRISEWRESFRAASRLLYDATQLVHRCGKIIVCNNATGAGDADAWLLEEPGRSSSVISGLGAADAGHMTLMGDERFRPFVIVHEFAHYAYGAADEYDYVTGDPLCSGDGNPACIMDSHWSIGDRFEEIDGEIVLKQGKDCARRFCGDFTHSLGTQTCESALDEYASSASVEWAEPEWVVAMEEQCFTIAVDCSAATLEADLDAVKLGLYFWIQQVSIGDRLGIYSFAADVKTEFPPTPMTGYAREQAVSDVLRMSLAGGEAALGAALEKAIESVTGISPPPSRARIVLVTSGGADDAAALTAALTRAAAERVRIDVIAMCNEDNLGPAVEIAFATGGDVYHVDPAVPKYEKLFAVEESLIKIAEAKEDNSGELPTAPERIAVDAPPTAWVEEGSKMATFTIVWEGAFDAAGLILQRPDGTLLAPDSRDAKIRVIAGRTHSRSFQVTDPDPGRWKLLLARSRTSAPGRIRPLAFSRNPRIGAWLSTAKRRYSPGEVVSLRLRVCFDMPITGLNVSAVALTPGGPARPLTFSDTGGKSEGDQVAGDATYHARFSETQAVGLYRFEVTVTSDGVTPRYAAVGERLDKNEQYRHDPIPRFERVLRTSVVVERRV